MTYGLHVHYYTGFSPLCQGGNAVLVAVQPGAGIRKAPAISNRCFSDFHLMESNYIFIQPLVNGKIVQIEQMANVQVYESDAS
jgi:hypothetical protein